MEKKMKIAFIIGFVLTVIFIVAVVTFINNASNEVTTATNNMKAHVGKRVILNKDTLTILDYSLINGTYTLSNGVKIDYRLGDSLKIVK